MKLKYVLFGLILFHFNACVNEDSSKQNIAKQSKTFLDTQLHLQFEYPENWLLDSANGQVNLFEKNSSKEDKFQENISIWTEIMPMKISDSTYMRTAIGMIKIKNPDMKIEEYPIKKIGGFNYYPFSFSFYGQDSIHNTIIGYTKVEGTRGYNFMCNTTVDNKEKYQPIFEQILATFKPL